MLVFAFGFASVGRSSRDWGDSACEAAPLPSPRRLGDLSCSGGFPGLPSRKNKTTAAASILNLNVKLRADGAAGLDREQRRNSPGDSEGEDQYRSSCAGCVGRLLLRACGVTPGLQRVAPKMTQVLSPANPGLTTSIYSQSQPPPWGPSNAHASKRLDGCSPRHHHTV
jgi:hypothetical protein